MAKYIIDIPDDKKYAYLSDTDIPSIKFLKIPLCAGENDMKTISIPTFLMLKPYTEQDRKAIEDEVWDLAQKLCEMNQDQWVSCFGADSSLKSPSDYDYQEAKAKYEAWKKQKDEICVGDEVIYNSRTRAVVLKPETKEKYGTILTSEFDTIVVTHDELEKTGRHFPEIAELLKKMKEE